MSFPDPPEYYKEFAVDGIKKRPPPIPRDTFYKPFEVLFASLSQFPNFPLFFRASKFYSGKTVSVLMKS